MRFASKPKYLAHFPWHLDFEARQPWMDRCNETTGARLILGAPLSRRSSWSNHLLCIEELGATKTDEWRRIILRAPDFRVDLGARFEYPATMRTQISFACCLFFVVTCHVACSGGGSNQGSTSSNQSALGKADCDNFCTQLNTNACSQAAECPAECDKQFGLAGPICEDQLGALYACYSNHAETCLASLPMECLDEAQAAKVCAAKYGCVEGGVSVGSLPTGEVTCGSDISCTGKKYKVDCSAPMSDVDKTCDCLVDGVSIGMCTNTSTYNCQVWTNCCNAEFFHLQ